MGYTRRNALALPISASQRPVHVLYTKAEQDIPEFSARQTERWRKMAVISCHKRNDNAFIMVPHFDVFFYYLNGYDCGSWQTHVHNVRQQ